MYFSFFWRPSSYFGFRPVSYGELNIWRFCLLAFSVSVRSGSENY